MMIWTNFIITSDRPESHLPTMESLPPVICTEKPNRMENTIRGQHGAAAQQTHEVAGGEEIDDHFRHGGVFADLLSGDICPGGQHRGTASSAQT